MNTIAAIALLAVCACVSASVDFTPHKLPCEYTIIQESNSTEQTNEVTTCVDNIYIHGTFGVVYSQITAPKPAFNEILLRPDLANYQLDQVRVFDIHTAQSDNCTQRMVDRTSALYYVNTEILGFYQETATYDSVSNGTFEGKPCKIYYKKDDGVDIYVFVDKDDYIIGHNRSSGDDFFASRIKYEMKAPLEKFVLDGKKYPGCSEYASVVPVVDECTDIKFKAKELPCEFTINADNDFFDADGQEYKVKNTILVHGSLKGLILQQESPIEYFSEEIVRSDVNDSITVAVYSYHSIQGKCEQDMINKKIVEEETKERLEIFEGEWIFHAKSKGEFKGQNVTIYYTNSDGTELMFFVDKDNYVVGLNLSNVNGTQTSSYSYSLEASLDKFTFNETFDGCDAPIYKVPSYDPCLVGSSSSSSGNGSSNAGNAVMASLALFIVSVMLALLF